MERLEPIPKSNSDAGGAQQSTDRLAAKLRGFGPLGVFAILTIALTGNVFVGKMVVLPVGAALVLLWVRRSHTLWLYTSALFGLGHYASQGVPGTEQATIVGLVFGTIFSLTGRIFMLMVAHVAFDLTALALIYWNVETKIAHLVFR